MPGSLVKDIMWTDRNENLDKITETYYPLVHKISKNIYSKLPSSVEYDDLVSYGSIGLLDAIQKFDPEKGFKFETYASIRINGSILDGLRQEDWLPRSVRQKLKHIDKTKTELEAKNEYSFKQLAEELELTENDLNSFLSKNKIQFIPFEWNHSETDDDLNLSDVIEDVSSNIDGTLFLRQISLSLEKRLHRLTDKERTVFLLYYYENLTLSEIGTLFKVTESRICQIHSNAIEKIKN